MPEGNVGGGTGMVCYGFKGGIGSSSRKLTAAQGGYTVGVLVQCNCGSRNQLRIGGLPVGQELTANPPKRELAPSLSRRHRFHNHRGSHGRSAAAASDQAAGTPSHNGIGAHRVYFRQRIRRYLHRVLDGNPRRGSGRPGGKRRHGPNDALNPVFEAAVQATEEAIINAMIGAETMTGVNGHTVTALPHERLREVLKKYNRLQ